MKGKGPRTQSRKMERDRERDRQKWSDSDACNDYVLCSDGPIDHPLRNSMHKY